MNENSDLKRKKPWNEVELKLLAKQKPPNQQFSNCFYICLVNKNIKLANEIAYIAAHEWFPNNKQVYTELFI